NEKGEELPPAEREDANITKERFEL
ncbi:hypothetical protein A2U01_0021837, partial [Trifolium medium]|nr:hypothetical protein [Trifolium medium]